MNRGALLTACLATALSGCGGGGVSAPPAPPSGPTFVDPPASARVSGALTTPATCAGLPPSGTLYPNSKVEPHVAINPSNALNLVAVWQQHRWSGGAAQAVVAAASFDGGATWTRSTAPFSICNGGAPVNGGDFERVTDPWITIAPDGVAYWMALAVSGGSFTAGAQSAMRVARSSDGGRTWSIPVTLIRDGALAFNDKNAITADPTDSNLVYAVWNRLLPNGTGPTWFSRTANGGVSWEPAKLIFDPGANAQTLGNVLTVLPNGTLLIAFTLITAQQNNSLRTELNVIRSNDKGVNWSAPIKVADQLAGGAFDPETRIAIRDGAPLPQIAAAPSGATYVVWQDGRFVNGVDGIAFSRSTDGGLTWSAPAQINAVTNVNAFTPQISVMSDGTIGVTYFDLRSNTSDAGNLPTEYWLARSRDSGATWRETRIAGPFDLAIAPNARGLFLGDYMGLASAGNRFIALFAQTTRAPVTNPTDIFALALTPAAQAHDFAPVSERAYAARAPTADPADEMRTRASAHIIRTMEQRVPGWAASMGKRSR